MNEKISVIIPLYNKEHEIERTLDSVLSQTHQNFEIIVVDDNSSDGGPSIVKSYRDPRISFIQQEHRGVSFTRNHGVNLATADLVAFLDADDEWMPKHLESILRLREKYPEAGIFSTAHKEQIKGGITRWPDYQYIPNPPWEGLLPDYFKSGALGSYPVNASTVVIPKKIFYDVGGFPIGCVWAEDADLFGKIALKYPIAFSWDLGAIYHWDATNRASERLEKINIMDEPFIKTAHTAIITGEVPRVFIESLQEYIARRQIDWAYRYIQAGNFHAAQHLLKQCKTKWLFKQKIKAIFYATILCPVNLFFRRMRRKFILNRSV